MKFELSNYNAFFFIKVLKQVIYTFIDAFVMLYFLNVSDNNILPLGIYKLVAVVAIFTVIYGVRNINKTKYRIHILRIGIILDFIYFLTIIILKERIVDYIYLVGILYGLEEGFYYSVYNPMDSDNIADSDRKRFTGTYTTVSSLLSIVLPVIFGSLIETAGFIKCALIFLVIIAFRILLSFMIKDNFKPTGEKFDYKSYLNVTKDNKRVKALNVYIFFEGMTVSEGALSYIITIYIAKVFSDSFSMGIFTSLFSIVSAFLGLAFAKYIKKNHYLKIMNVVAICVLSSLIYMLFDCNTFSIILFKFFYTVASNSIGLINVDNINNLSNSEDCLVTYKVEYWLSTEKYLVMARVISNAIFILMAYTSSNIILVFFVICYALYLLLSINFQKEMEK